MSHPLQVSATAGKADFSRPINTSMLKGKSILVTGGASGLGAEFVRAFGEAGAYVTIADIQAELGQKHAEALKEKGYHVIYVRTDVTDWASQINAFKRTIDHSPSNGIDIVVTAAGLNGHFMVTRNDEPPSLDKDPPQPSAQTVDVNLTGVYYTTQLALHYFKLKGPSESTDQGRKNIILISSLAGYVELPCLADYMAAKYGVRGIFKALRNNLGSVGVRINLVAPWFVNTPMAESIVAIFEERGVLVAKMETVVEAVVRCATDDNINGKSSLSDVECKLMGESCRSGRAIAVAPSGNIDLRDDAEGLDAGIEIEQFLNGEAKGYLPAMLDFKP
ncbi:MAG: hypothetical protein M1830_001591 [Pleopsidium flavum]|nr:MAG: hypothetical protein M1830_001591 [Pleopsidium flavum]